MPRRAPISPAPRWRLASAVLLAGLLDGCAFRHLVGSPVQAGRRAQDRAILSNLRHHGRDGDWLVVRSYTTAGDAITALTDMPVSHAAVLDLTHDQVIEADAHGVHSTKLEKLVDESHRVLLLRPRWSDHRTGREAAATAAGLIGKEYDFAGLVGADDPDKYYCSELALAAWRKHIGKELEVPAVVAPGQLYFWARVLWDSGPRRDE